MAGEEDLFRALNGAGANPALDAVALLLDVSALLYVVLLWAAPLWASRRRALAFDFALAILVVLVVTEALKFAIGRPRPAEAYANVRLLSPAFAVDVRDPAFPSGHTSRAFALAAVLGLRERRWMPVLLPYAALVGLARVYEGAHYPTDVLAGAVLGFAIGALFWALDTRPGYVAFRARLIGRWLSPGLGGRSGSSSPPGPGPT